MADTVLGGRWKIHYLAENRQKRIERDTSVAPTTIDSVNALYSALQNHFDELSQMDDGTPMSAQTPTEYTIGIIDAGDKDPWFIDRTSIEFLKGGAIKTASWKRNDDATAGADNTGIIRMAYTVGVAPQADFDTTDIGRDIRMTTDLDTGTILDFNTTGATKFVWIRSDSTAAGNSFDNAPTANGEFTVLSEDAGQVWQVVAIGPTFVDETADANSTTVADWQVFPAAEAVGDYVAIGFRQKFRKVVFDNAGGTAGTVGVVTWEYWNGTTWAALTGVSDGTSGFTAAVANGQVLTFTVPSDWATTALNNAVQLYYIRARITTVYTVNPVYDRVQIAGTGRASQSGASTSGESLWANVFTLGTIEINTHVYVKQNNALLTAYKATSDWWEDGQIDILINVKEVDVEVDEGVIQVFARQHTKTFDNFEVDLTAGGRNPVPLSTGNDLDNQVGYRQFTGSAGTGTFQVGEVISKSGTNKKGVLTAVGGTSVAPVLTYYLIGDPLTDFVSGDTAVTGATSGATCTAGAPADVNAATFTDVTITLGADTTFDVNENDTTERYSIVINTASRALTQVYQRLKFITRRGETADLDQTATGTIAGQFYIGSDTRLVYGALTGTISTGQTVTQLVSGATGIVVAHQTTAPGTLILRNSRGTFNTANDVQVNATNFVTMTGGSVAAITPVKSAPFGTFAGGKFFGAPGVVLQNVPAADAKNFQLIDDSGTVVNPPNKVTASVGNTRSSDKIAVFRLTAAGGTISKTRYNATVQAAAATTVVVATAITTDEPGKTAGGILRLVDASASLEYRIRYSSWTGTTFTLASATLTAAAGTNATTIVATAAFTAALVKVGDLIFNVTRNAVSYVISRDNDNQVTISPAITGQVSTDDIRKNVLPVATTTTPQDTVYVPIIDVFETTGADATPGTEEATVTFTADVPVKVRARNAGSIIPFEQDSTITSTGMTVNVIRTADSIFTP